MKIPDDYIDVAERIRLFKEQYPEGSLQGEMEEPVTIGDTTFIVYCAAAYRTPDDGRPGIGWAWEPVPGPTPFTKDSELMNAETSAWGRAIVALGLPTKKIASSEEVRNRQESQAPSSQGARISQAQHRRIGALVTELETRSPKTIDDGDTTSWVDDVREYSRSRFGKDSRTQLTQDEAAALIEELENWVNMIDVPFGDVPADGATVT
jgi:hypothetical protein